MLNYLAREGYLVPNYFKSGRRGRTRYYSYRDLVIARLVQKLLDAGIELKRLKDDLKKLSQNKHWSDIGSEKNVRLLATDGSNLYLAQGRSTLIDLTRNGQLAFAFVLDVACARKDVEHGLSKQLVEKRVSEDQVRNFDLVNQRIRFA